MAILGLLLLAAATAVGVEFVLSNTATTGFEVFGYAFVSPLATVVLYGAIAGAVAMLGLWMIVGSLRRRRVRKSLGKHRVQIDELQVRAGELEQLNAELVRENDRLRADLQAHQLAEATLGGVAVPPGVGQVAFGDQITDSVRKETIDITDGTLDRTRDGRGDDRVEPYPTEVRDHDHDHDHADHDHTGEAEQKASVLGRFRGTS
jgi:uncharacterized integral membrane protein